MSTWILYGLTNVNTKEKYIGVHNGDVTVDNYITSSTNRFLKEAIHQDLIERVILAHGTKEEMYNQEYFFLSLFDAKNSKQFYNKTNGGGPGVVRSFRPLKEHVDNVTKWVETGEWFDPSDLILEKKTKTPELIELWGKVTEAIEKWKEGGTEEFPVTEESVHTLYITNHNQARAFKLKQDKLSSLITAFKTPGFARKHITPVIVLVDANGRIIMLLDGNHRVNAASVAGWDTFPVIKVDYSHFDNDAYNFNIFGNLMNHVEAERTGNTLDDLVMRLRELQARYPSHSFDSVGFKAIAKEDLGGKGTKKGGMWLNSDVIRKCDQLAEATAEALARSKNEQNFIDYSTATLARYWQQSTHNNGLPVIYQSLDGVNNGGIGGAIAYAVENFVKGGKNEANIIIHFKSIVGYLTEADSVLKKLDNILTHGVKSKINIFFAHPFNHNIVTRDGLSK